MTVDIAGVSRTLTGRLGAEFTDLIRIAAFVLGADGAVSRGKLDDADGGQNWQRHFHFVVAVETPSFWSQPDVTLALEETLGFLSQDTYAFEFRPLAGQKGRTKKIGEQLVFSGQDGQPFLSWDHIDEISLFSGGLDSFAGAADLILAQKRGTILVTHRSASKMWATQTGLLEDLRALAQQNGGRAPAHVAVEVTRHDDRLRTERSQRTRSFLYMAIAGAVASLVGRDRVCMYENGIVGINLPIAGSVVGARATRTAHPRVLSGFSKILSHVAGAKFKVENPFALKTRAEVIQGLASSPAVGLAKQTMSCAHIHRRSTMYPHCGICSQCIDRQFGFLGAGMEQHDSGVGYELKLATDEWKEDAARALLLAWIAAADQFAACTNAEQFMQQFGDAARAVPSLMDAFGLDGDAATRAVYELHKRHGETVGRVLAAVHARTAKDIRAGKLKPTTLPMLLFRQGIQKQAGEQPRPGADNQFRYEDGEWHIRFRSGPVFQLPEARGLHYLCLLLASPGQARTTAALVALSEGRDPSGCVMLDGSGKEVVRGRITALEKERDEAEEFCDTQTVQRCQAEIDALSPLLKASGATAPADEKVARAVETHVRDAIAAISKHSKPLADHLSKNLQIGSVYWYRRTGVAWDIIPLAVTAATQTAPAGTSADGVLLVIDIPNQRVTFRGQEIPTTPPNNLQPQAILALAALAQRAGEAVTMAEVADRIWKLGGLARKPTSPDQRDLKYKLMNPFTKAMPGGEAKRLIEAVRGTGLRLNLPREQVRIVLRDGPQPAAAAAKIDIDEDRARR
jgi:hypothetical protein